VPGIIGAPVPHLQKGDAASRVVDADELFIDIGATDEKGANGKVKVGDFATFATTFTPLSDDPAWPTVRGKAFDDRAGCAARAWPRTASIRTRRLRWKGPSATISRGRRTKTLRPSRGWATAPRSR